jgi:hypothetical protein
MTTTNTTSVVAARPAASMVLELATGPPPVPFSARSSRSCRPLPRCRLAVPPGIRRRRMPQQRQLRAPRRCHEAGQRVRRPGSWRCGLR